MSYINPLHPPVHPAHRSATSALSYAIQGGLAHSQFLSPTRCRVPQPLPTVASKWKSDVGRYSAAERPIAFDYLGYAKQGVSMRELSCRGAHALAAMICGAGDPVLLHTGLQKIMLCISWPGYAHVEWVRPVDLYTAQGPLTRAQLGAIVAMNYARFIEKTQYERASSADWLIGPGGVSFEHLVLVSLRHVCENVWQADVAFDTQ